MGDAPVPYADELLAIHISRLSNEAIERVERLGTELADAQRKSEEEQRRREAAEAEVEKLRVEVEKLRVELERLRGRE